MRPEKEAIAADIRDKLESSAFVILADYSGMTVAQAELLRCQLGERNAHMMVLPNRQFCHVARGLDIEGLGEKLVGPTAMFYGDESVVDASKVLKSFARENDLPVVKLGAFEGKRLSADDVKRLADLPSIEELQAMVVRTLAAPMTQLVGVMQQKLASLVYVLSAHRDQKGEG